MSATNLLMDFQTLRSGPWFACGRWRATGSANI